jgi:cellulose synthase/poly-beta-1,6-N-acetylglucosamine synthase-like glycosyltransferase
MIFTIITAVLFFIMVAYMSRHLLFTYFVLFGKPQQFMKSFKRIAGIYTPKVTILIPAHNEEFVIGNLLDRMTELTYPKDNLEVVVIDDGSTDATGEIVDRYAKQHSYIKTIHRKNGGGGKSAALNDGFKFTNGEIVLTFDADYFPQLDIVEKLVAPFVDPEVGAVQGRVIVLNEEDSLVSKIVTLERIGGYRIDQQARDELVLVPQYGGTVGGFRRDALEKVGGWDRKMLTEDTDLTMRLILNGYQIRYVNDAEAYEEAVTTWRAYWNQRYRWAKGHMQCAIKYLGTIFRAEHLSNYEKAELTLLLCVYFMPIFVLTAWGVGVGAYLTHEEMFLSQTIRGSYFFTLSVFTYSTVGNFAPFFEIGSGAYLDNRKRLLWLLPVLTFSFVIMAFCCSKALADIALTGNKSHKWNHTLHNGNGHNGNGRSGKNGENANQSCNRNYINGSYNNGNRRLLP